MGRENFVERIFFLNIKSVNIQREVRQKKRWEQFSNLRVVGAGFLNVVSIGLTLLSLQIGINGNFTVGLTRCITNDFQTLGKIHLLPGVCVGGIVPLVVHGCFYQRSNWGGTRMTLSLCWHIGLVPLVYPWPPVTLLVLTSVDAELDNHWMPSENLTLNNQFLIMNIAERGVLLNDPLSSTREMKSLILSVCSGSLPSLHM